MSTGQLHRDEQAYSENLPQADPSHAYPQPDPSQASAQTPQSTRGAGTDVVGEPVKPLQDPDTRGTQADPPSYTDSVNDPSSQAHPQPQPQTQTRNPPTDSYTLGPSDGNFPSAQPPRSFSASAGQQQEAATTTPPSGQSQSGNPYVRTSSSATDPSANKGPMDSIMQVFNKWSKKAEGVTGNVWTHLRTGPNVADTAMGRIALGAKAMSEGGLENVYRHTFDVAPDEHLLKTYACYLSTSNGPVAGTLYISSHQLAFCSDRPLAMPASSPQADPNSKTSSSQSESTDAPAPSPTSNKSPTSQQCYYKVVVPISKVDSVNPSENTQKRPPERYVEVRTTDGHEFWFMGFVNYDKGVKNLQETVRNKENATGTIDANQLDRDTTSPTTNGYQMDRGPPPATTADGNKVDRGANPSTTDTNQMDRDTTHDTTDASHVAA